MTGHRLASLCCPGWLPAGIWTSALLFGSLLFFFLMIRRPPRSTLFPYHDALPIFNKRFDFGSIQIRAHDPHALAIRPVKLPVFSIKLQLLRSERAAVRNDVAGIPPVNVRALDGTVIGIGIAHIGPVEVTCFYVHNDAVGDPPSFTNNDLQVGAVGI